VNTEPPINSTALLWYKASESFLLDKMPQQNFVLSKRGFSNVSWVALTKVIVFHLIDHQNVSAHLFEEARCLPQWNEQGSFEEQMDMIYQTYCT